MLGGGLACGKEQAASEPQTQGPFPRPDRVLWRGLRSRDSTATPQSPRGGCSWYSVVARPGDASDAAVVAAIRRIIRPLLRMRCEQEPHAR
jgi:hypothetical protein